MPDDEAVYCFVSHKCAEGHAFIEQLRTPLAETRITLLKDPFETGHDVQTRIQSVVFHSFVFLYSEESWASPFCREELRTAYARSVPVLVVRLSGDMPAELRGRIYTDVVGLGQAELDKALAELSSTISIRARLYKQIEALDPNNEPKNTLKAAQDLVDVVDRTLLAESLEHIASFYRTEASPTTRFWLALAIGKAGTCKAKEILKRFSWENHPLPREGIRQAQEMLNALKC